MAISDGGGAAPTPQFTGTQTLQVEPSAIPGALKAFSEAHERISRKVTELESLPIKNWAGDPVSSETARQFQQRSKTGGADSAVACLKGYQRQLEAAIDSLQSAHDEYVRVEGDNYHQWGKYHH